MNFKYIFDNVEVFLKKKKQFQENTAIHMQSYFSTWDMFCPADDDHQLAVSQVAQRGQSLDVALRHGRVRHGIDLLRLRHQQVRHYLCD